LGEGCDVVACLPPSGEPGFEDVQDDVPELGEDGVDARTEGAAMRCGSLAWSSCTDTGTAAESAVAPMARGPSTAAAGTGGTSTTTGRPAASAASATETAVEAP
jgi:hypothetical protein